LFAAASGSRVGILPPGFTANDSIPGSHSSADFAGVDTPVLAAANIVLLGQDFLKQVRIFYCSTALSFDKVMFNLVLWFLFSPSSYIFS